MQVPTDPGYYWAKRKLGWRPDWDKSVPEWSVVRVEDPNDYDEPDERPGGYWHQPLRVCWK